MITDAELDHIKRLIANFKESDDAVRKGCTYYLEALLKERRKFIKLLRRTREFYDRWVMDSFDDGFVVEFEETLDRFDDIT